MGAMTLRMEVDAATSRRVSLKVASRTGQSVMI